MPMIDPSLVPLVDEVRSTNRETAKRTQEFFAKLDPTSPEFILKMRATLEPDGVHGHPRLDDLARERVIAGPAGEVQLRIFLPEEVRAVYLRIHGGGWMAGGRADHDPFSWELAQTCGVAVVNNEYRLAPENRHPAAQDDCEMAACWLVDHALQEFGTDRLIIGGESSGAHLAVTTLLRLRDRHGVADRFMAANLDAGVYDLTGTPSRLGDPAGSGLGTAYFEGLSAAQLRDPDVSPLWGNLRGLCPALFTSGTDDLLLDDTLFMAGRWEAAGNHTELAVYPAGPHGVAFSPTEMGRRATARMHEFVNLAVGGQLPANPWQG